MRNMRLKGQILEYIEDKERIRLRDLLYYLNERGNKIHGKRKVAGNLTALGWRQQDRGDDVYRRMEDGRNTLYD